MYLIASNCRLNDPLSPTLPYLRWLLTSYRPSFSFLQETKISVNRVAHVLSSTNPSSFCGVDVVDTRSGLAVFCWGSFSMDVVAKCTRNYVVCKITTMNGKMWHCLFLYGASQVEHRRALREELKLLLRHITKYVIVGDINQVDSYADTSGGANYIRGREDIINWKHDLHLMDIPFDGPRHTWTNNMTDSDLIMERLDRAYASQEWLDDFPLTTIQNFPIIQ